LIQRVETGVAGFDQLIEQGFPKDSVILIAGSPGAGKTTFAAQFLLTGAQNAYERGVYVCFAETKTTLIKNLQRFGWDFQALESQGKVAILDLTTTEEPGIQANLNTILETIRKLEAKRLVIDSFTAFSMAISQPANIRFLIHLLYKFLQRIGCTTIVITDVPWGTQRIGSGVEEFIADGIILMESYFDGNGELKRRMRILKMRATDHSRMTHEYEITPDGIRIHV